MCAESCVDGHAVTLSGSGSAPVTLGPSMGVVDYQLGRGPIMTRMRSISTFHVVCRPIAVATPNRSTTAAHSTIAADASFCCVTSTRQTYAFRREH